MKAAAITTNAALLSKKKALCPSAFTIPIQDYLSFGLSFNSIFEIKTFFP